MNPDQLNDIDWYLSRTLQELNDRLAGLTTEDDSRTAEGEAARALHSKLHEVCQAIIQARRDIQIWRSRNRGVR